MPEMRYAANMSEEANRMNDKIPTIGLCLYQPWATMIVRGEIPLLIRPQNYLSNGRIGIIATIFNPPDLKYKYDFPEKAIVGSIVVDSVEKIIAGQVKNFVIKKYGDKITDNYPFSIIKPHYEYYYIYTLSAPKEFKKSMPLKRRFLRGWVKISDGDI
jgi:hypothetical protein